MTQEEDGLGGGRERRKVEDWKSGLSLVAKLQWLTGGVREYDGAPR